MKLSKALNHTLAEILQKDARAYIVGEDIAEPYGGAFKVTKGLSERYPDRLLSTPMSEQGFLGLAIGMALRGYHPIVEIMFGDFVSLCVDQFLNHASKFVDVYGRSVPLVLRTPMGGYRGYGATHSQSIEKLFFGLPNLEVVSLSLADEKATSLQKALGRSVPVLYIENKIDYGREVFSSSPWVSRFSKKEILGEEGFSHFRFNILDQDPGGVKTLVVTYGGMLSLAFEAVWEAFLEEEWPCEILVPERVSPLDVDFFKTLSTRVSGMERLVILEEGWTPFGWGSEVIAALSERGLPKDLKVFRVGARLENVPAAREMEEKVLPGKKDVLEAIMGKGSR
ncbi:MAG TPA: transketolase C-terminal domain-containing protein [Thermotogota bacterium]|nr:transketolase C-terminal domain-containing protein [Thermotogota bacterium]HRW93938.1 transketolase C-terminal domain-containing protein [Thermotogota bacterium]